MKSNEYENYFDFLIEYEYYSYLYTVIIVDKQPVAK